MTTMKNLALFCVVALTSTANGFVPITPKAAKVTAAPLAASTLSTGIVPPKSVDDIEQDQETMKALYDGVVQNTYGRFPLTIKSGKGCRLLSSDGKDYLDCVSGIATCSLGHSNEALTSAIAKQMEKVHHVSNLYWIPAQAALADWLVQNSIADKVFFCNSGAEANEAAIKCARRHAYNRGITSPVILTAHKSFHGRTLATVTATGQPKYHKGFGYNGEMVPGFQYIHYNDIASLEEAVEQIRQNPDQGLAAIMLEALQGEGGIVPGQLDFFKRVRELCDENGALMICDEVQVGMGRTGTLWGYENLAPVKPDVFTSAKALGGGVPIGAMMASGEAATVFGPGDHASTFGGNPLACAAGLAVAQYMYDNNVLENVQQRGQQLEQGLNRIQNQYETMFRDVRGWGLIRGIECNDEVVTPGQLVKAAMEEGLLLVGAGANVVRFVPPLIISAEEIDEALEKFERAVVKVAAEVGVIGA